MPRLCSWPQAAERGCIEACRMCAHLHPIGNQLQHYDSVQVPPQPVHRKASHEDSPRTAIRHQLVGQQETRHSRSGTTNGDLDGSMEKTLDGSMEKTYSRNPLQNQSRHCKNRGVLHPLATTTCALIYFLFLQVSGSNMRCDPIPYHSLWSFGNLFPQLRIRVKAHELCLLFL